MNAVLVLSIGIVILIVGYIFYGGWLAKQWGVDDSRPTPAHELEDGMDYVPAKAPVLMGHHFSSIAGAGPINGPIQAAVFGWMPVVLWVLIGGIFFGAVHDYGALFASIRHKGQSIGEVVALNIGDRAKKLFLIFSYLTLVLVVAAFASIVASTFQATYVDGVLDTANASVAMISLLFIVRAVLFGFFVYRRGASLAVATIAGCVGIVICLLIGLNWHPIYLSNSVWMWIIGAYILVASVAPVWILLQPRDYLSSFLLYAMMAIAAVGVIGAGLTGADAAHMDMPAFTAPASMTAWRPPAPPWAMSSPLCSSPSPAAPSPASTPWWAPAPPPSSWTTSGTPSPSPTAACSSSVRWPWSPCVLCPSSGPSTPPARSSPPPRCLPPAFPA